MTSGNFVPVYKVADRADSLQLTLNDRSGMSRHFCFCTRKMSVLTWSDELRFSHRTKRIVGSSRAGMSIGFPRHVAHVRPGPEAQG